MRRELLVSRSEMDRLPERVGRRPFDHIYQTLRRRCARILETQPDTETMWRAAHEQGQWNAATAAVGTIQGRIFDLVICHRVDRNAAYRDRAIEELKNLAGFSTWVDPCHRDLSADLCTGEACATVAVALDWLGDDLSAPDRIRCLRALREKGLTPYLQAVGNGAFWHSCYHAWNAVVNSGAGLAGLLLGDEEELGRAALARAREGLSHFFDALGREGGWDEGIGYWGYAMRYVLLLAQGLSRALDDRGLFRRRGMDATGLFPIYFTPHGSAVSFGDFPAAPVWGAFYLLVRQYGLKEVCWWLDRYAFRREVATTGYSDMGLALLFRPVEWEDQPRPDLVPVKAFNEIGWAALADRWPEPHLYAALKTGDLSANHAQFDTNSVQVMVNGEILLRDPGSPDYTGEYLSPDSRLGFYEVQASAHNTLTVGGREHRIDAVGSIVEAQDAPGFRYVAGEAGNALGEDVQFVRHLVMHLPAPSAPADMLVVLDDVRNLTAEKVAAAWHVVGSVSPDRGGRSGSITGRGTGLHYAFAASCDLSCAHHPPQRPGGSSVITLSAPAVTEATLVSVFALQAVPKVTLSRTARGDVTVGVGPVRFAWTGSRHGLTFRGLRRVR